MDLTRDIARRMGYLLYIVSPNETSFERHEDVPDYIVQAVPIFVAFVVIELIFNFLQKNSDRFQLDDGLTSISQGIIQELSRLFTQGTILAVYIYVYNNYRIVTLPWNSAGTWFFALLAVDFAYYWMHRWGHEVNLAWSGHQVHHSSEFYNLTTALRQSALQAYYEPILYLPLALVLSPSAYLVHQQFNRLYQFLIHTEAVQSLGPLEFVLNTPSHHRVHHGILTAGVKHRIEKLFCHFGVLVQFTVRAGIKWPVVRNTPSTCPHMTPHVAPDYIILLRKQC